MKGAAKRQQIRKIWSMSGQQFPEINSLLQFFVVFLLRTRTAQLTFVLKGRAKHYAPEADFA